jgi:hypothetical protein
MSVKVEDFGHVQSVYEKKFEVTQQWCLAINNIDYIRQSLPPFVKELGADDIIAKLGEYRSPLEAQRCSETLKNVIENALDTEKNRILELIDTVAEKMSPALRKFLTEGAELLNTDSNSMDRLMMYLEESLKTLHSELNELNFERMLDAIWREIAKIMEDMIQYNLDVSIVKAERRQFKASARISFAETPTAIILRQPIGHSQHDGGQLQVYEPKWRDHQFRPGQFETGGTPPASSRLRNFPTHSPVLQRSIG